MNKTKLTWKEKLLFATPLLFLFWPVLGKLKQNGLEEAMRKLAGPNSVSCGVASYDNHLAVEPCAFSAYKAGIPFFVALQTTEVPGNSYGVVRTPQGQIYVLNYQSGFWGTNGEVYHVQRAAKLKWDTAAGGFLRVVGEKNLSKEQQVQLLQGVLTEAP